MSGNGVFTTTRWSLIAEAKQEDKAGLRAALGKLVTLYMPALRAHLIFQRKLRPDAAEEVLSGFVADKIVEKDLIERADPSKGRFRNYLLVSLNNYVISRARMDQAQRRGGAIESLDQIGIEPAITDNPSEIYELEWARAVLMSTLDRLQQECIGCGRPGVWGIFEARIVNPILHDMPQQPYGVIAAQFEFTSPAQASNALVTAKRGFARLLRQVVSEYVPDSEIDNELVDLRVILGKQSLV